MSAKVQEIRNQTEEELELYIREKREELMRVRFQHHTGQLDNVCKLRELRRSIARAETVRSERSRGERAQGGAQ
jgi:large subunit ribosomal protein L29